MKKNFIEFYKGRIYYAYMKANTNVIHIVIGCNLCTSSRKRRDLKITITSATQFMNVKKYFGLCTSLLFITYPDENIDLLPEKNREIIVAISPYAESCDLVAVTDSSEENFYHLPDGKFYTKEALFNMYKLKKIQTISNEITKLSNRIAEISALTVSDITEA